MGFVQRLLPAVTALLLLAATPARAQSAQGFYEAYAIVGVPAGAAR